MPYLSLIRSVEKFHVQNSEMDFLFEVEVKEHNNNDDEIVEVGVEFLFIFG